MSELKYKTIDNIIWFLGELQGYDSSDIDDDDFDVMCETECGIDSRFSVSIVDLAGDARGVINQQQEEIKALKAQFAAVEYLIAGAYCERSENNAGLERGWLDMLYRMIDTDNDNQCLNDVRADAIEGLLLSCGPIGRDIQVKTEIKAYAQQLREIAK